MMKMEKMRKAAKEIARALRCTATVVGTVEDCAACRYWRKETLTQAQKEKLGVDEWTSCDVDRVAMDAANLLDRFAEEME